jgi:hypothetical protein
MDKLRSKRQKNAVKQMKQILRKRSALLCVALVMRKSDGRAFWVGCGCFFLGGAGGGKRMRQGTSAGSVFAGRRALLNSPIFLCYILYIEQWKFRCYMLQTISNGAPESSSPWADTHDVRVSTP